MEKCEAYLKFEAAMCNEEWFFLMDQSGKNEGEVGLWIHIALHSPIRVR